MTVPTRPRLLLRLTSRAEAEATVSVAADLGRSLGSDLAALFVEEEDALAACALPFATVLGPQGAVVNVDRPSLETMVMREAAACERLVRRMAERGRLRGSFHTGRGRAEHLLADERRDEDIVVVRGDRLSFDWHRLRQFAADLAPRQGGLLIVPEGPARSGRRTIIAIAGGDHALPPDLAARIARAEEATLEQIDAAEIAHGYRPSGVRMVIARIDTLTADIARALRAIRAPVLLVR